MAERKGPTATREDELDFCLNFLRNSKKQNDETRDIDQEVLENYMVLPYQGSSDRSTSAGLAGRAVLKDPETHQIIETLLAKLMLMTLGEKGFMNPGPVGREDAFAASMVRRLLESSFRRSGNYRSMYVAKKDMLLFGATVLMPSWSYEEGYRTERIFEIDPFTGEEFSSTSTFPAVLRDDVSVECVDLDDFFPDPGHETIATMMGAGRRFVIPAFRAHANIENLGWNAEAVGKAIAKGTQGKSGSRRSDESDVARANEWREGLDRPWNAEMLEDYEPLVGYEWFGDVPYKAPRGERHRRLVVLNGELVDTRANPSGITRRVPMYEMVVNPIKGRFRGIAPGAVARFTQSYTDALLICTADAVIRKTAAPIVYQKNSGVNVAQLKALKGPIAVRDVNTIKKLDYDPPIQEAFMMLQAMKNQMREQSSAHGGLQGAGLGSKRFSATEATATMQNQADRPSMMAELLEREYLPALGMGIFELYQQFIADSEDLANRIGKTNTPGLNPRIPFLGDIQGPWDIEFVGSSRTQSKQTKLQFIERAFQVFGSIPGAAPLFPWAEALTKWLEYADMREIESMVADPDGVEDYIERAQAVQGSQVNGNNNGSVPRTAPMGLLPAQVAGGAA